MPKSKSPKKKSPKRVLALPDRNDAEEFPAVGRDVLLRSIQGRESMKRTRQRRRLYNPSP